MNRTISEGKQVGATAALALSAVLASLGTSIANIALPVLAAAFVAPFPQVQLVVVAYLAGLTVSVLIAGWLGDRYGLRSMLITGLGLFLTASLACALAPSLWHLICARFVQGVGAAFLMTVSIAMMRQITHERRIGRAMGLLGTVSALGTALGPPLGGLLIAAIGWRAIFWVQVPLTVTALLLAVTKLPAEQHEGKPSRGRLSPALSWTIAPNLFVNLLVAAVMMTTLVISPFYLSISLGFDETWIGLLMAIGPVISIVSGIPSGRLVDLWGSNRVILIGLTLLTAGAFLMAFLASRIGLSGYLLSIAVLTPGYQLFQAANNTAALAEVPKDRRGAVAGFLSLSRNIGLIAGASAMGAVFTLGVGTQDLAHASAGSVASGLRLTFLLAGGLMMIAILTAGTLRSEAERRK